MANHECGLITLKLPQTYKNWFQKTLLGPETALGVLINACLISKSDGEWRNENDLICNKDNIIICLFTMTVEYLECHWHIKILWHAIDNKRYVWYRLQAPGKRRLSEFT